MREGSGCLPEHIYTSSVGLQGGEGGEEFVSADKLQVLTSVNAATCLNRTHLPQQTLISLGLR